MEKLCLSPKNIQTDQGSSKANFLYFSAHTDHSRIHTLQYPSQSVLWSCSFAFFCSCSLALTLLSSPSIITPLSLASLMSHCLVFCVITQLYETQCQDPVESSHSNFYFINSCLTVIFIHCVRLWTRSSSSSRSLFNSNPQSIRH